MSSRETSPATEAPQDSASVTSITLDEVQDDSAEMATPLTLSGPVRIRPVRIRSQPLTRCMFMVGTQCILLSTASRVIFYECPHPCANCGGCCGMVLGTTHRYYATKPEAPLVS